MIKLSTPTWTITRNSNDDLTKFELNKSREIEWLRPSPYGQGAAW